jgi:hypothetical protein
LRYYDESEDEGGKKKRKRKKTELIFYFNSICHVLFCLHSRQSDAVIGSAAGAFF